MAYGIRTKDASGNVTLDTSEGPLIRIVDVLKVILTSGIAFTPITKPEYAGCIVKGTISPGAFTSATGPYGQISEDYLGFGGANQGLFQYNVSTPVDFPIDSVPPGMFYISGSTLQCRYRPVYSSQIAGLEWTLLIIKVD